MSVDKHTAGVVVLLRDVPLHLEGYVLIVGKSPDEIENERKRTLVLAFSAIGTLFLSIFGAVSLVQGRITLFIVLFLFVVIVLAMSFIIKKATDTRPASLFLSSTLLLLTWYLLLSGGADGSGVYWTYSLSMLMVILAGPKVGSIYMGLYLLVSAVFIQGPFPFVYDYSSAEFVRIIASSIALYVLILTSEWIRIGSYNVISKTSENHRYLASIDPLTGLLNRNGLMSALKKKAGKQAVMAILDIDGFKQVNDSFGHDFGDLVLSRLSKLLKNNVKGGDLTVRWGGEEFLIIFYDISLDSSKALMNKIKDEFEQVAFDYDDAVISVTFSAGLATFNDISTFEAAVKLADERLYHAKNTGRNKVVSGGLHLASIQKVQA
ncbi:GGDEF domain-containing protein [Oceanisphaera sp.]|uniref:GGDEF domain-containing protein n=1 Tax=Oceanisphaera sp. TaxID=1929979 RepID=UPI003A8D6B3E